MKLKIETIITVDDEIESNEIETIRSEFEDVAWENNVIATQPTVKIAEVGFVEFSEEKREYLEKLLEKINVIEQDKKQHDWNLNNEIYAGITVRELITLNSILHRRLGVNYESEYQHADNSDTLIYL